MYILLVRYIFERSQRRSNSQKISYVLFCLLGNLVS